MGQGDAAFLEFPSGHTMLIDAGEDDRTANYLHTIGCQKIDYLIATHPHSDHIGGMSQVVQEFEIGAVYMPRTGHTTDIYLDLLTVIDQKGLTIFEASAGIEIDESDLEIRFLSPSRITGDLNNDSAVLKITYGDDSFLFMGDAEKSAESQINENVKATLLKVGHHGSDTSTGKEFLDRVAPQYAIISCGRDNNYGHPTEKVLNSLQHTNAKIYRTDLQGTILFSSNGLGIHTDMPPWDSDVSSVPSLQDPPPVVPPSSPIAPSDPSVEEQIVYVTATGNRYHRLGCRYLSKSSIPMPISKAKKTYQPCQVCQPAA